MCGIAGLLARGEIPAAFAREREISLMTDAIRHRGPDGSGFWLDQDVDLALGHRRLSIIDLSPLGRQPMVSASARYVVTYNGEIYNFPELRSELLSLGHRFAGTSDTEVLLAAVEQWTLNGALSRATGMFAFAIWDRKERVLSLARDRFGEKPLYYSLQSGTVLFGSELRALGRCARFQAKLARENIPLYLAHGNFPDKACVWEDVLQLPPGHLAEINLKHLKSGRLANVRDIPLRTYWDAKDVFTGAQHKPYAGTFTDAVDDLERRLKSIVKAQMVSDVPLGAFLSGGIDSSLVVALMADGGAKVKTFTIGYDEKEYNEAPFAQRVALHLNTEHHEMHVDVADALAVIHDIGAIYDEPFADHSQIPTRLVSQAARQHVTVALTGDGGDEIFGGYNRHVWIPQVWRNIGNVSPRLRSALGAPMAWLAPETWNWIGDTANALGFAPLAHQGLGFKMQKLKKALGARDEEGLYRLLTEIWSDPSKVVRGSCEYQHSGRLPKIVGASADRVMFWDTVSYLPNDILTKVDRASMSVSLETRAPFLDHHLAEWSWSLPVAYKIEGTVGKKILRSLLARYIPPELFERPKHGFGIPIAAWLRGPLREWAEALLEPTRMRAEGLFNHEPIHQAWLQHQSGRVNRSSELWCILVFQSWLDQTRRNEQEIHSVARTTPGG